MQIPNYFQAQWSHLHKPIQRAIGRVGRSGWLILGPEVKSLEKKLADYCGCKHAIGCGNGLEAIQIGLRCMGFLPGETVLTTPLSAFATTLAIIHLGGKPAFVDTDETGNIDLDLVEGALKKNNNIRYLLPVHLYGHALDLDRLKFIKKEYGLKLIEDCAQAIGASWNGVKVGTVGQVGALSFYPTKNLGAYGDGGAILTNSSRVASMAYKLRDYGQSKQYLHKHIGFNSRLDEMQAAILGAILPHLDKYAAKRQELATRYIKGINHPLIRIYLPKKYSGSVWHLFPVVVKKHRQRFMEYLKMKNIATGIHYPRLIPDQPALTKWADSVRQKHPRAGYLATHEVSLPLHPYLDNEHVDYVIDNINSWPEK